MRALEMVCDRISIMVYVQSIRNNALPIIELTELFSRTDAQILNLSSG